MSGSGFSRFDTQASIEQFKHQTSFISRFEHAWADFFVNAQRPADNDIGKAIETLSLVLGWSHEETGRCKN